MKKTFLLSIFILVLAANVFATGPTVVQIKECADNAATCAFTSNVTAGNLIIVAVGHVDNFTCGTMADSVGTVYTSITSATTGGVHTANQCVFGGAAGGTGANTVNPSSCCGLHGNIAMIEVSGVSTTLDQQSSWSVGGDCTIAIPAVTVTKDNSFMLCAETVNGVANASSVTPAGFTLRNSMSSMAWAYGIVNSGSNQCVFTENFCGNEGAIQVVFGPAATTAKKRRAQIY